MLSEVKNNVLFLPSIRGADSPSITQDGLRTPVTGEETSLGRICLILMSGVVRISTVSGETGASDELRDPRGFAVKYVFSTILRQPIRKLITVTVGSGPARAFWILS